MTPSLMTAGAFIAIAMLIYLVGRLLISGGADTAFDQTGQKRSLALGPLTHAFAGIVPALANTRKEIKADLVKAGFYHRHALEEFLGVRNAAICGWTLFIAAAVVFTATPTENYTPHLLIAGVVIAGLLYGLPRLILSALAKQRVQKILYALPDALDMVNMMVVGGLPVRGAIRHVKDELDFTHPPLATELSIIDHQTEARSLEYAFQQFAERIDEPDVITLATTVQHSDRIGGNVASALQEYSDGVRRSRRQRAEERGNKASVKILFPIVFCLAPPIYVLLLGPAVLELRRFLTEENRPGGALSQTANERIENLGSGPAADQ